MSAGADEHKTILRWLESLAPMPGKIVDPWPSEETMAWLDAVSAVRRCAPEARRLDEAGARAVVVAVLRTLGHRDLAGRVDRVEYLNHIATAVLDS